MFECNRYGEDRERWKGAIKINDSSHEHDVTKRYQLESNEIEKETIRMMWIHRQIHE